MIRRLVLLISCSLLWVMPAVASHLMGGEITWDCLGSGKYQFNMKLYRDCSGIPASNLVSLSVFNHPSVTSIPLVKISQQEISPVCNAIGPAISCDTTNKKKPKPGAVEEFVYQSGPITLAGIPPAAGWIFIYDDFSRNGSITNLMNPGQYGFTLRAFMYSYNGKNADPCFDSSPTFLESPKTIICTGNAFTYNHNAIDRDLDSLTYTWAEPLDRPDPAQPKTYNPPTDPILMPFAPGFSYTNPMPDASFNAKNIPAKLNPFTGEISFTSYTVGNFVVVVKVQAWKCGQLVAEIFREMQIILLSCGNNSPPVVTTTNFSDTVTAGATVSFVLKGTDPQFLPNGSPQTMTIDATGSQFGAGFTNGAAGCLNPPCATLNPPPPVSGQNNVSTTFNWTTSCSHVFNNSVCNSKSNTYNFVIRTQDDFCPAPAVNITTISITVVGTPVILAPKVVCASVLANGDVALTWTKPADPSATFNSYHIFTSKNPNGPFKVLDSIFNYNQTTYTHVGAGANTGPVYYFIESRSGCLGKVYAKAADTISSIYLKVTNPGTGTAILKWNPLAVPNISTSTGVYKIYREFPAGTWTQIGSTAATSYIDTVNICSATINYRVEIADKSGCISVSSIDGNVFKDLIAPVITSIDTVSVEAGGNVDISWPKSTSKDVVAYVIYKNIGGIWTPVDTVKGIGNTSYINTKSTANTASEDYRIAAYDSCKNTSALGAAVHSIFLKTAVDVCKLEATLSWNAYAGMPAGLQGYHIYVSVNGAPYTVLANVSAGQITYTHTGLVQLSNYCYYVSAYNTTGVKSASSNRVCKTVTAPKQPSFSYLKVATVAAQNKVDLSCYTDGSVPLQQYKVLRSDNNGAYGVVGYIPPGTGAAVTLSYSDFGAQTSKQSYYYKIMVMDSCGFDGLTTNIGRTMYLTAQANPNYSNTLTWNDYEQWLGAVSSYNIYRGIDGVFDPLPVANIPFSNAGMNVFNDDVVNILQGQGLFSYYIEALEGAGNPYAFMDKSLSNIAEAIQEPSFYIPNAFVPAGVNQVFKPMDTFIDKTDYTFNIFNRWGQLVFETHDSSVGWDGYYQSNLVEQGVYIYQVKYKSAKGQYFERKGTVTLMR